MNHHLLSYGFRVASFLAFACLFTACGSDRSRIATTTIADEKINITRLDDEDSTVAISNDRRPYIAGVFDSAGKLKAVDVFAGTDLAMSVEYTGDGKIARVILYQDLMSKMAKSRQIDSRGSLESTNVDKPIPPPSK